MTLTTRHLSDGTTLGLREAGAGEAIVLLHGVGMQSAAWAPQIQALSQSYRVLALDLPGHGLTSALPQGAQLSDFVEWLGRVLADLNLDPVNLAGHSMGALIAGGFASLYSDQLLRVGLLNGVFLRSPAARQAVEARAGQIATGQFDLKTPLDRWFGPSDVEQAAREQVADWLSAVDITGYQTAYSAFASGDDVYADRMNNITCPLLALTGDGDKNSTPEMSKEMAKCAQNGQAVIVEGHRHMVNLTAPDIVNDHLLHWLQRPLTKDDAA